MNNKLVIRQQRFLSFTKQKEIEKWVKDVRRFNGKSIYKLTWGQVYKNLHKLGIKNFLQEYKFSSKKKLKLFIARSNLCQEKIILSDFEIMDEFQLIRQLKGLYFSKVMQPLYFNPKNHKLSTIHYCIYHETLNAAALSLGFGAKQSFLNFFARTQYDFLTLTLYNFFAQTLCMTESAENKARNLNYTLRFLAKIKPTFLQSRLIDSYDAPLSQNTHFVKNYNTTLDELKRILENEKCAIVMAILGGNISKKLRDSINISLNDLQKKSREELEKEKPILSFLWGAKLYQIFSGRIPIGYPPFILHLPKLLRPDALAHSRFFRLLGFTCVPKKSPYLPMNVTEITSEGKKRAVYSITSSANPSY